MRVCTRTRRAVGRQVRSTREKREAVNEAEAAQRRAQAEARAEGERCDELEARLDEERRARAQGEDAAAAQAAQAAVDHAKLERRVEAAEAAAREAASDAALAHTALEQAKTMEELWFEQREALLDELEALRRGAELAGDGEHARKGRWKARADEIEPLSPSVSPLAAAALRTIARSAFSLCAAPSAFYDCPWERRPSDGRNLSRGRNLRRAPRSSAVRWRPRRRRPRGTRSERARCSSSWRLRPRRRPQWRRRSTQCISNESASGWRASCPSRSRPRRRCSRCSLAPSALE